MKTLIVIPARFGSTRFQGKPLKVLKGKTLLQRVVRIAEQASTAFDAYYLVATDHQDILDHCRDIDAPAVMTSTELASGTDRAIAAIDAANETPDFILNLQGDAPFTPASHVAKLIEAAERTDADVYTPVIQLDWDALDVLRERKQTTPFSGTTCVRNAKGDAMWFSKQIIPAIRKEEELRSASPLSPVYRHIGLYGYRLDALRRFAELPMGHYEKLEGLEQLRFLENGMTVSAVEVETPHISMSGVDTPEDAALAEALIDKLGDPYDMDAA